MTVPYLGLDTSLTKGAELKNTVRKGQDVLDELRFHKSIMEQMVDTGNFAAIAVAYGPAGTPNSALGETLYNITVGALAAIDTTLANAGVNQINSASAFNGLLSRLG